MSLLSRNKPMSFSPYPMHLSNRAFGFGFFALIGLCSTAKDVSSYVADAQKQEAKIAEMRAAGADESTIKKQEEVQIPAHSAPALSQSHPCARCLPKTASP